MSSPHASAEPPFDEPYVDLDAYLEGPGRHLAPAPQWCGLQLLPVGLIYPAQLANPKESRFSTHFINEQDEGWLMDATLGTRVGILRCGTCDGPRPQGFQVDAEGSSQIRIDLPDDRDLRSADFRAGVAFTFGTLRTQSKLSYYHLSSHLADEFLLKNPDFTRVNYVRDVLVIGQCVYLTERLRVYGEAGWAFYTDVSKPWEFQFGADYAPAAPTGPGGAPFFAINGSLREEVNFGGGLTVQAGWAWQGDEHGRLTRVGMHYYNGESPQYSFFDVHEQQIGLGVWYDF
jgi:hypothetical protein